jgi:hypothetical protein
MKRAKRTKNKPQARASLRVTEVEGSATEALGELLGMLAQGRKGPIQVMMCHRRDGHAAPEEQIDRAHTDTEVSGAAYAGRPSTVAINLEPPRPVGEVPHYAEGLVQALEGLSKQVHVLSEKLSPLLRPEAGAGTNSAAGNDNEAVATTELGERLRQAIDMVAGIHRRVAEITERTAL